MKLYYDLLKEKKAEQEILDALRKNKKSLLEVFDKVYFIEKLYEALPKGKTLTLKLDEKKQDYPSILSDIPPRITVQDNGKRTGFAQYLESFQMQGFSLSISEKDGNYFLTLKKSKDEKLDLKLKLDRDKTIDLSMLFEDAKDKAFFGVKSFYYVKKTG